MQRIFEEIAKEITGEYNQMYEVELKILLNSLNPPEKFIVAKHFVEIDWNVGSLSVLSMLQECGILSATEYILSLENKEQIENVNHIQLVLSDFIEKNYELIANFLTNYELSNNLKLKILLEEFVSGLLKDFEIEPSIIKKNYLTEIKLLVIGNFLQISNKLAKKFNEIIILDSVYINFKNLHINCLLELDKVNMGIAFTEFDNWIRGALTENTIFCELLKELIVNDSESLKRHLLRPSLDSDFKNWKYFVILLYVGTKFSNDEFRKIIRTHLKDLFKDFVSKMTKQLCLALLITARIFCSACASEDSENVIQNYTLWYKSTFSDMKYLITTKEFKDVIAILTELINLENSPKFLQVHASTSISPPALCNEIVLKYKSDCRFKISLLNVKNIDLNESIVIDDD